MVDHLKEFNFFTFICSSIRNELNALSMNHKKKVLSSHVRITKVNFQFFPFILLHSTLFTMFLSFWKNLVTTTKTKTLD